MKFTTAGRIGVLFVLLASVAHGTEETFVRRDLGFRATRYTWESTLHGGFPLLKEKGMFYGLYERGEGYRGATGMRAGFHLYLGQVDYEGHTWDGRPIQTDVLYFGGDHSWDLSLRHAAQDITLYGFLGLAPGGWLRVLDDTMTADGEKVIGATEWWFNLHGRLGAGSDLKLGEHTEWFFTGGIKLPIFTRNRATYTWQISETLKPKQKVSMFGEVGLRWKQLILSIGYNSWEFAASDPEGPLQIYQPDSTGSMVLVNLGWVYSR